MAGSYCTCSVFRKISKGNSDVQRSHHAHLCPPPLSTCATGWGPGVVVFNVRGQALLIKREIPRVVWPVEFAWRPDRSR